MHSISLNTLKPVPCPPLRKPLTPIQRRVFDAIANCPGRPESDLSRLVFGVNSHYTRSRTRAALKGLRIRGLIRDYIPCHCSWLLVPYGEHAHKCLLCKSVYANVYLPERVMKVKR